MIENNKYVKIVSHNLKGYEMELSGLRCVGGHDPISLFFKDEVNVFNYIYFPEKTGSFDGGKIKLTYEEKKYNFPYVIQNLKGSVNVRGQEVIINLKIPKYSGSGKIENYQPYEFNGTYKINR